MAKLFDYNNPIWRFMGKVADMFFLSLLWFLFSLPIVTIGASTTALCYVTLKLAKDAEGYLWQSFLRAFKESLKQSTVIWLILLALFVFLSADLYFYYNISSAYATVMFWMFFVLSILYLFIATLLFPLAARLDADIKTLFMMTFMVSIKNFSWVMLMVVSALCLAALGVFVFWPVLLITPGALAYIHSKILVLIVFPKYNWNEI